MSDDTSASPAPSESEPSAHREPEPTPDALDVVAIGGEPATGKSTLVTQLLRYAGPCTLFDWGLLKGQLHDDHNVAVLGQYRGEDFGGTDTLSMAVIDDAEDFTEKATAPDSGIDAIVFEGDRLYNDRFLSHVRDHPEMRLHAYVLTVPDDILTHRHDDRGDTQSATWLKGRQTKYDRYAAEPYTDARPNATPAEMDAIRAEIASLLGLPDTEA